MPLIIDILRHGEAAPSSPDGDAARALSETGAGQVRLLARQLAAARWRPDRVFSSPLRRARETAALMLEALDTPPALEALAELGPEADPADLNAALEGLEATRGHILLVSHMPLVARLCGYFCGRPEAFHTGDLARLECANGPARGTAIWRGDPVRPQTG